ncbi:TPA: exonuclease SbcCD subunit D [Candidatus Woesearchaeota archaeon]|nr:exonuclease SbcCD subunit D [Candidatus Woesearchaeota archaeon]HII68326.1 exonuclease SbcCD subunit D [Candidatus Woesearchaeota archaeon]
MRFAHMADCHIGGWREQKLREVNSKAFEKAIAIILERNVDFVVIAGDLFNTSMPPIDGLKMVTSKLKVLKDRGISVYIIPGSHDYSPSGKTMLDVLEEAGLVANVYRTEESEGRLRLRFTTDQKTGVKLTGILGRRGQLEREQYELLDREHLEKERGHKIFLFHSAIEELRSASLSNIGGHALSLLPRGFDYYAGGHVHAIKTAIEEGYGPIAYPGPLFPNSFSEFEELGRGGMNIVSDWKVEQVPIVVHHHIGIRLDCSGMEPISVAAKLVRELDERDIADAIVTIRLSGSLFNGRPSDIDFKAVFSHAYSRGAYVAMRNASGLESKEFEEVAVAAEKVADIEEEIIHAHLGQIALEDVEQEKEKAMTLEMMRILSSEKREGETIPQFEQRIVSEVEGVLPRIKRENG